MKWAAFILLVAFVSGAAAHLSSNSHVWPASADLAREYDARAAEVDDLLERRFDPRRRESVTSWAELRNEIGANGVGLRTEDPAVMSYHRATPPLDEQPIVVADRPLRQVLAEASRRSGLDWRVDWHFYNATVSSPTPRLEPRVMVAPAGDPRPVTGHVDAGQAVRADGFVLDFWDRIASDGPAARTRRLVADVLRHPDMAGANITIHATSPDSPLLVVSGTARQVALAHDLVRPARVRRFLWNTLDAGLFTSLVVTPMAVIWVVGEYVLRRRAKIEGHCPDCGYDLRASPMRCPECGRVVAPTRVA